MNRNFILLLFIFIATRSLSQSLSPERVLMIKNATVQIVIGNGESSGTGFFVTQTGTIVTCWHVIKDAILVDSNKHLSLKPILVKLPNGKGFNAGIPTIIFKDSSLTAKAIGYDFCLLVPITPLRQSVSFLQLGNFDSVKEGQSVYTCGYPIGIDKQFVTRGILSTKYINNNNFITNQDKSQVAVPRSEGLLDITMNRGNSGGPIVMEGNSIEEDKVIGIADFIIIPAGGQSDLLIAELLKRATSYIDGVNTNLVLAKLLQILTETSIGVSGCVSINHLISMLEKR